MPIHVHECLEAQAADLLYLPDAARHFSLSTVTAALGQLAQNARPVVHAGAEDERETEALLVLGVESIHQGEVLRAQGIHPGRLLLLGRLLGQGAIPQVSARQIRKTPQEALLTYTGTMNC